MPGFVCKKILVVKLICTCKCVTKSCHYEIYYADDKFCEQISLAWKKLFNFTNIDGLQLTQLLQSGLMRETDFPCWKSLLIFILLVLFLCSQVSIFVCLSLLLSVVTLHNSNACSVFGLQAMSSYSLCFCESMHWQSAEWRGHRHGKSIVFMWSHYQNADEMNTYCTDEHNIVTLFSHKMMARTKVYVVNNAVDWFFVSPHWDW